MRPIQMLVFLAAAPAAVAWYFHTPDSRPPPTHLASLDCSWHASVIASSFRRSVAMHHLQIALSGRGDLTTTPADAWESEARSIMKAHFESASDFESEQVLPSLSPLLPLPASAS